MVLEPDHAGLIRALRAWAREANPEATLGADAADALVALLADARRYRWLRHNAKVSGGGAFPPSA